MLLLLAMACSGSSVTGDSGAVVDTAGDVPTPWADAVVASELGEGSGHGADLLPGVVLGPPSSAAGGGSLDVVSLGREGWIVVELVDWPAVDGPGDDLAVFENPFPGWTEAGVVEVSLDGETWSAFPCDTASGEGCAGFTPTNSTLDEGDPSTWGGDTFDLGDVGLSEARFVRITDAGVADYAGIGGGFDLDAVGVMSELPR